MGSSPPSRITRSLAIRGISSEVSLDPDDLAAAALRMEIRADSIQLLDEVSDKDRREIELRVMREEALEAAKVLLDCVRERQRVEVAGLRGGAIWSHVGGRPCLCMA